MVKPTLARRTFLGGTSFAETPENAPVNFKSKVGDAILRFPIPEQELPDVPAPAEKIAILGGLMPYSGVWGHAQAAHLLRRTGFGVKKADLDLLLADTMEGAVDHVLNVATTLPPPPVNNYNNPDFTDPVVAEGDVWLDAPYDGAAEGYRIESWRGWWYDQILNEEASIRERMTMFWHNHFSTQTTEVYWGKVIHNLNQKLRQNALGNFKDLVKTVTKDSMMLYYLNGYLNTDGAPDENYARELQELFTVGKDSTNQYTEDDVVAAARVLTGWRINFNDGTSYHDVLAHDFADKQFSAFYNNTLIPGSVFGDTELNALVDMIFARPEVALYICRKIYRWFVYYDISPATEQMVIEPLAQVFRDNGYEIKPVMDALLKSEHFFNAAQTGCFIKTPVDQVLGTLRSFNLTINGTTPFDELFLQYVLSNFMSAARMLPGDPPNVAGWQAFRQTPQFYRIWINGDSLRSRNSFTDVMAAYYLESTNDQLKIDHIAFVSQFSDPSDPVKLVEEVTQLLLPQPLSASKKFLLKAVLLSGLPTDSYWTAAWLDYVNAPTDPMAVQVVWSRLQTMHLYLMRLPEFQLA